ncbi:MAG: SDR family NAD(P)-dependent oxidoreductase, partial [Chloroflexota bacterium]
MGRLRDRVILITGSTGIAAATALRCASEGASVFIVSRVADHAEALAARVGETGAPSGRAAADQTSEAQTDSAVQNAVDRFGRIDGFFSVAGGSGRRFGDGQIHTLTQEAWEATAALNLTTQVLACARVVRQMRDQPPNDGGSRGSILLMGSVTAVA